MIGPLLHSPPPPSVPLLSLLARLSPWKRFVLLDGLSPTNAYQFRLRFTRGVDAQDEQLGIDVLGDDTVRRA